jgi:hypothetical protein
VTNARVAGLLASLALLSCGRDTPATDTPIAVADSVAAAITRDSVVLAAWPADYGVLIAVPAPSGEGAALIPPLAPSVEMAEAVLRPTDGLELELFARAGSAGTGTLSAAQRGAGECPAWPQSPLAAEAFWRVALVPGTATSMPLDSIEGLTPQDSSRLAIEIARLASAASGDTSESFRGLPFVIRGAWRTPLDSTTQLVVALVARTLALEDDPRSEQLTIIAERLADGALVPRYSSRRTGSEAQVDIDEILAAVRFTTTGRAGVLIERADARGTMLLLLERDSAGWTQRWQSPRTGC